MKVLRIINGIMYLISLIFCMLDLIMGNLIFKKLWQSSLGLASFTLLFIILTQLRKEK